MGTVSRVNAGGRPGELDADHYVADPSGELRRLAGQHWFADGIDLSGAPMPMVLSLDGVRATLRDRRLSARSFTDDMLAAGISTETAHQLTPLFRRDGDAHRRQRALLSAAFTPRRVERLRPVAAAVATRLSEAIAADDGACRFVADFAAKLPPEVFTVLFGLPVEDSPRLARLASSVAKAFTIVMGASDIDEIESAAAELRSYSREQIERRRAEPGDDLVTHLMQAEVDGERLDDAEVVAVVSGFIFAGSETTKTQLREMIVAFAGDPEAWDRLSSKPELVPNAVEEVLRHRPIVPALTRVALEPFAHEDLSIDAGGRVVTMFTTANHDPAHFDGPDTFDISRENAGEHVTFGWGPHFCLGAGLARVELQESLRVLADRFGPPQLAEQPMAPPEFGWSEELEVTFPLRR